MDTPIETPAAEIATTEQPETVEIQDPIAVLKKNQQLLEENKKLKSLKQFEGLDFNEVEEALTTLKAKREKNLIEKGDYETAKKLIREEEAKKLSALETEFNQFIQKNAYKALQADLTNAHDVRPEYADDVATILQAHFIEPSKEGGEIVWKNKDGIGDAADLAKIMAELKTKKPAYFKSETVPGSGAPGSIGKGGSLGKKRSEMSVSEKSAFVAKYGQEAFLKLPS